ncbi:TetR/AcrR family transcriptional regulator [Pseudonocardia ailaonensis]|uniref:TetR/AcrR family transcriptional regulator n=1 Tax=Pseudonocardia ailaonensis TaxID=367279 RepID=A0ABN2N6U2_9PSEU
MAAQDRKERDRAERHRLIVTTARALAEAEGWEAVTTRKLAERIEYSQPVLYSHFRGGKDEIVGAVALEGFAELAAELRAAGPAAGRGTPQAPPGGEPRAVLAAVATAYLAFAARSPAVYDAMFRLDTPLAFASDDTPAPLREGFEAILGAVAPLAGDADPGTLTEVVWATLHGLVTLTRAGRLLPEQAAARLTVLVDRIGRENRPHSGWDNSAGNGFGNGPDNGSDNG